MGEGAGPGAVQFGAAAGAQGIPQAPLGFFTGLGFIVTGAQGHTASASCVVERCVLFFELPRLFGAGIRRVLDWFLVLDLRVFRVCSLFSGFALGILCG